jgi:hypothetical protein
MTNIVGISGKAGAGKDTVAAHLVEHHGFVRMALADEMKRFAKKVFAFTDEQLWGPSESRNGVDARFEDEEEWEKAEDRLFEHGPEWCQFLLNGKGETTFGPADKAWTDLLVWFDNLRTDHSAEWNDENTLSARVVLQTIGTEFGRAQDEDLWVNATISTAKMLLNVPMWYTYTRESGLVKSETADKRPLEEALSTYPAGVVVSDCRFKNELAAIRAAGGRTIRIKRPGTTLAQVGVAGHASEAEQDTIPDTDFDHVLDAPEGLGNLAIVLTAFIPNILRSTP